MKAKATANGKPKHSPAREAVRPGTFPAKGTLRRITPGNIEPDPDQPRKDFDAEDLSRLARSIQEHGLLQPIRVRWDSDKGKYIIIFGERRWRAAQLAGLDTLSCLVHEKAPTSADMYVLQLVENCCREDLAPLEEAEAFRALQERTGSSARKLAEELGVDNDRISDRLKLLDLPESVRKLVAAGRLDASTARELARLDEPEFQEELAIQAVSEDLTCKEVRNRVRTLQEAREQTRKPPELPGFGSDAAAQSAHGVSGFQTTMHAEPPAPAVSHRATPERAEAGGGDVEPRAQEEPAAKPERSRTRPPAPPSEPEPSPRQPVPWIEPLVRVSDEPHMKGTWVEVLWPDHADGSRGPDVSIFIPHADDVMPEELLEEAMTLIEAEGQKVRAALREVGATEETEGERNDSNE